MGDPSKEWLTADAALDLVRTRNGGRDSARSICERAHAGLIKARAQLFIRPEPQAYGSPRDTEYPNADIPKEFWWADGGLALEAKWVPGDFSTWIDHRFHWRAFGVQFDRDGIEAMLRPVQPSNELIEWGDFPQASIPELQKLSASAARDAWWTWPEAIAWIGRRDPKDIATLRFWGREWIKRGDGDPTLILSAQATIARQYCASPEGAEADLINAILSGQVGTSGRLGKGAVATDLSPSIWRGAAVAFHNGEAVLVDAKTKLTLWASDIAVHRESLFAAFPILTDTAPAGPIEPDIGHSPDADELRKQWMRDTPIMNGDRAFSAFRKTTYFDGIKQYEWRKEWTAVRRQQRGRPRKIV